MGSHKEKISLKSFRHATFGTSKCSNKKLRVFLKLAIAERYNSEKSQLETKNRIIVLFLPIY